jgi:hypothetical protein
MTLYLRSLQSQQGRCIAGKPDYQIAEPLEGLGGPRSPSRSYPPVISSTSVYTIIQQSHKYYDLPLRTDCSLPSSLWASLSACHIYAESIPRRHGIQVISAKQREHLHLPGWDSVVRAATVIRSLCFHLLCSSMLSVHASQNMRCDA